MKQEFDYNAAVAELEKIASKVEDPSTPLDLMDCLLKQSSELVGKCREYLRNAKQTLDNE